MINSNLSEINFYLRLLIMKFIMLIMIIMRARSLSWSYVISQRGRKDKVELPKIDECLLARYSIKSNLYRSTTTLWLCRCDT